MPHLNWKPLEHIGAWPRVSPEEPVHGLILSIEKATTDGSSDEIMQDWRRQALTVLYKFLLLSGEDTVYWKAINIREIIAAEQVLVRSAYQWIFVIVMFMQKHSAKTAKDVAKLWDEKAELASDTEKVTDNMIDNAITIYKRALSIQEVNACIVRMEAKHGKTSAWNSIAKLHLGLTKVGSKPEYVKWCFQAIDDADRIGDLNPADITTTTLDGRSGHNGPCGIGKGIMNVMSLKLDWKVWKTKTHKHKRLETL